MFMIFLFLGRTLTDCRNTVIHSFDCCLSIHPIFSKVECWAVLCLEDEYICGGLIVTLHMVVM